MVPERRLILLRPVLFHQKLTAIVYIQSDLEGLRDRLVRFAEIGIGVLLISLLAAFGLSWIFRQSVAKPIVDLSETARVVTREKNYSVRAAPTRSRDEIATLIEAFNGMLAQIQQRDDALQKALESLRAMGQQVRKSVDILAASAGEILAATAEVASGATDTATAIGETTRTVGQVKQTAQLSTQKAQYVSNSAQKSAQVSEAGQMAASDTIQGMNRIQEQMESIGESIVRLSEQGQAIGEIVATVNDLADQLQLLAVNAAIQAAKAGEHGKGFAVVAQEIRNLAEQSKRATAQVRAILGDVQKSTGVVAMAAKRGSKTVEAGVRQSAHTGEAVQKLTGSITNAALAAQQIAVSAQQQLAGMD